jgi:hypothetical protein
MVVTAERVPKVKALSVKCYKRLLPVNYQNFVPSKVILQKTGRVRNADYRVRYADELRATTLL